MSNPDKFSLPGMHFTASPQDGDKVLMTALSRSVLLQGGVHLKSKPSVFLDKNIVMNASLALSHQGLQFNGHSSLQLSRGNKSLSNINGFQGLKRNNSSKSGLDVKKQSTKQPHRSSFTLVRKHSASSDSSAKRLSSATTTKKNPFDKIVSDTCLLMHSGSIKTIASTLPHHLNEGRKNESWENSINPVDVLKASLKVLGRDTTVRSSFAVTDYFLENTEEHMATYNQDVIQAVRSQDLETLQRFHDEGRTLQSCNRFGESLIHMACRRGFTDVAYFLMKEAGVSIKVKDDYGRTPMHDACWAMTPNFDLMNMLLDEAPEMILISDKRGHTPLHYVRREHWDSWAQFLLKKYKKKPIDFQQ